MYVYVRMYAYMCVCMYVCMYMHVRMYVYVCMCARMCTHTHTIPEPCGAFQVRKSLRHCSLLRLSRLREGREWEGGREGGGGREAGRQ